MTYFDQNIQALRTAYPQFEQEILVKYQASDEISILPTPTGLPSALYKGAYLHSRHNPEREAARFIRQGSARNPACCIFFGFGLGYFVEAYKKEHPDTPAIVVEPDVSLFLAALSSRQMIDLLSSSDVSFLLDSPPEALGNLLNHFTGAAINIVAPKSLYMLHSEYFDELKTVIDSFLSRAQINRNTLKKFGRLWVRNFSFNMGLMPRIRGVRELDGVFRGIPAIILAAGPSLETVLPILKSLRRKCLIIAVDTSLRACVRAGVIPDFLIVVDPQYWNSRHIDGINTEEIMLISESSTYPSVFRRSYRSIFFCSSLFPLGRYIEEVTAEMGKLGAGGSVATSAWDFARIIGGNPILFAGLDLGFPERSTHYRGNSFENIFQSSACRIRSVETTGFKMLHDAAPFSVDSNAGGKVLTDKRLILYKWWFENQQKIFPLVETLTITLGGVLIEGISHFASENIKELEEKREQIDSILNNLESKRNDKVHIDRSRLQQRLDQLLDELEILSDLSSNGIKVISALKKDQSTGNEQSRSLQLLNDIDHKILQSDSHDVAGFLLQQIAQEILDTGSKELTMEEVLENTDRIYNDLQESIDFHKHHLAGARRRL